MVVGRLCCVISLWHVSFRSFSLRRADGAPSEHAPRRALCFVYKEQRVMSKFNSSCRMLTTLCVATALAGLATRAVGADKAAVDKPGADKASAVAGDKASVKTGSEATRLDTFTASDGATYFALSLPPVAATASDAHDMIVLFDTSASQAGVYRDKALEALSGFLGSLGPKDRVQLVAVDLNAIPLTEGFVAPRG